MQTEKLVIEPKGEDGYHIFSVRIENDIVSHLDCISTRTGRSRNEIIRILLDFALSNCDF